MPSSKKKRSPQKKLSAKLTTPIIVESPPIIPSEAAQILFPECADEHKIKVRKWANEIADDVMMQRGKKLKALLDQYGISNEEPERWFLLAWQLAADFVPGFEVHYKPRAGRPQKWNAAKHAALYYAVEETIVQGSKNSRPLNKHDACRSLSKKEPWKNLGTAKTLYNQYMLACDSIFVQSIKHIEAGTGKKMDSKNWEIFLSAK